MEDEKRSKRQLIEELHALRQRVADLKGFEEEIRLIKVSHEKFSKAFLKNSVPASIMTMKEGKFVDISDAFLGLMGRKRDEVVGHTPTEIGLISEAQRVAFFNELITRGHIENLEAEVRTKDGALRHGLFNAVLMSINNEKYLLTVMTDITERKRAAEALRASEATSRALINAPTDSVLLMDAQGLIVELNEVAVKRLGKSREDLVGTFADNAIPADIARTRRSLISRIFETGEAVRFEDERDGAWYDTVAYPIADADGRVGRIAVIARDISDRKHMEEELTNQQGRLEALVEARTKELEIKTRMLEDINVALKVLLRQRDDDRQELENQFATNITGLILPYIEKMKSESLDARPRSYLTIIEANLKELLSPMMHNMRQYNLTPKEIIVASLIKDGKTTKDIADIMCVGTSAIDSHRNRIRKKLNLIKEKTNLQSYLCSIK